MRIILFFFIYLLFRSIGRCSQQNVSLKSTGQESDDRSFNEQHGKDSRRNAQKRMAADQASISFALRVQINTHWRHSIRRYCWVRIKKLLVPLFSLGHSRELIDSSLFQVEFTEIMDAAVVRDD